MKEVEVKILEVTHKDLEPKLISLGAKKIFDDELNSIFFDTEDSKIRDSYETFRLRQEGLKVFLTHKKKIPSEFAEIRDETEIGVSNFEEANKLVVALGFKEFRKEIKKRVSYKLDNIRFEFDKLFGEYSFVPEFLEIEAKNIDDIYKYAKLLGFSKEDCKAWSGEDVVKYYRNK